MNIKRTVAFVIGAVAITGCVSVESTRAQLNSNNPQEVKDAEETIYKIATTGKDKTGFVQFTTQQQVEYVQLISNQELLAEIFARTYFNPQICAAVARKMDFSKKNSIVSFIEKNGKILDEMRGNEDEIVNAMLSTATVEELVNAGKYLTSHYPSFSELREPLAMKLANVATDQEVLFQLVDGTSNSHPLCFARDDSFRDIALAKLTDQSKLMSLYCNLNCYNRDKVLAKLQDKTICDFIQNDSRYGEVSKWDLDRKSMLVTRIKDENQLAKILIARDDDSGMRGLLNLIKDEKVIARIVVDAKNANIREMAAGKLKGYNEIVSVLMNDSITNEVLQLTLVKNIEDETADVKLYDGVKNPVVQKAIFAKLSKEARIEIHSRSKAENEKLIANANCKGSETFELAGFYLGMNINDAEKLIGYHFPDFLTTRRTDSDGDGILYVSYQKTPFCYADKSGKVYQLNFGKKMLKKWYNYDVQTYMEWARKYSIETRIDMKFKMLEKDTTVSEMDMSRSYKVWFHQESYQYKHNTKEYRLTYFGEEKEFTWEGGIGGDLIKEMAAPRFRYLRGDPGSLRAAIERD